MVPKYTPQTGLVLELGWGWGWHSLAVWLHCGSAKVRHVAAGYTAAGQRASERLAGLDPGLRYETPAFDYHDPVELAGLAGHREAVVFSVHPIEQIPSVGPALLTATAGVADSVRCVHFEPIGRQLDEGSARHGRSRANAEHHDCTRDLAQRLHEAESRGLLQVEATLPDLVGHNPDNSTSVVGWRCGVDG